MNNYRSNWDLYTEENRKGFARGPEYSRYSYTATEILNEPEEVGFITGFDKLDGQLDGLKPHKITLFAGLPASGKTSVLTQLILNATEQDLVSVANTGSGSIQSFYKRMLCQAAGPESVSRVFNPDYGVKAAIERWLFRRVFVNESNNATALEDQLLQIEEDLHVTHADLVVLDSIVLPNKTENSSSFIEALHSFADKNRVHLIVTVCQKKKTGILRPEELDEQMLTAADNAMLIHSAGKSFTSAFAEAFPDADPTKGASNYLELVKRDGYEIDGNIIPLFYDEKTKRMLEEPDQDVSYGWEKGK